MENEEFVPISVAARETGYSYSMVFQLMRSKRVMSRYWYERPQVKLQDVIDYKLQQNALGQSRYTPIRYRQEAHDATPAE